MAKSPTLKDVWNDLGFFRIETSRIQNAKTIQKVFYCKGSKKSWLYKKWGKFRYRFTNWAITELCTKMKFCKKSYVKAANLAPRYAQILMRKFLGDYDNQLLIRYGYEGNFTVIKVRGVLSTSFSHYDNNELLSFLEKEKIAKNDNILNYYVDDTIFELFLSVADFKVNNEDWKIAFRFVNSDVGASRVRMELVVYKVICTNGMICQRYRKAFVEQIHIGNFRARLEMRIINAYKFGISISNDIQELINSEVNSTLDKEQQEVLKEKIDRYLTDREREIVDMNMKDKEKNYYWYSYVISEMANRYSGTQGKERKLSIEKREELQRLAGDVITRLI